MSAEEIDVTLTLTLAEAKFLLESAYNGKRILREAVRQLEAKLAEAERYARVGRRFENRLDEIAEDLGMTRPWSDDDIVATVAMRMDELRELREYGPPVEGGDDD